jgi:nitrogen regulatory protein P-II 1
VIRNSSSKLKQVEAIVRREKFPDVDSGLRAIGVGGMTVMDAGTRGMATETELVNVGGKWTFSQEFLHRVMISLVVDDDDVRKVVNTIVRSAGTNSVGDGKVFVTQIEKAIDIASGEADNDAALDLGGARSYRE